MKRLLLTTSLLLLCLINYGQESIAKITREYISNGVANKTSSDQIKNLDTYSLKNILESSGEYLSDSLAPVRKVAFEMVYIMALRKINEPEVKKAVNMLISGCKDKDEGIVYANLRYLKYFRLVDFDAEARIKLGQMARVGEHYYDQIILLTGLAGITDLTYDYREMLQQKKYPDHKTRWALHLVLARLGDKEEADYCLNKIKKLPVSDDVVYDLIPDLTYIRTKDAFDYLLEIIKSDEKNCSSSNPDSDAKIICAFRVIKLVAPYINNFPVKTDKTGDIADNNYDELLQTVRQWIDANKASYTLDTQIY